MPIVSLPSIQCHRYHFLEPHTILCRDTVQRHPSSESKAHKHPIPHHEVNDFTEGPMSNTLTQAPPLNVHHVICFSHTRRTCRFWFQLHSHTASEDNYWSAINIASRKESQSSRMPLRHDSDTVTLHGKYTIISTAKFSRALSALTHCTSCRLCLLHNVA